MRPMSAHITMAPLTGRGYRRRGAEAYESEDENGGDTVTLVGVREQPGETPAKTDPETKKLPHPATGSNPTLKPETTPRNPATSRDNQNSFKINGRRRREENFDEKVARLRRQVRYLESQSSLSADQSRELNEKAALLASLNSSQADTGFTPVDEYLTAEGAIDRQRKRALLKTAPENEHESGKKQKYENSWEPQQVGRAMQLAALNPDDIVVPGQDYSFVFDESQFVDFAEEAELPGQDGETTASARFADIQAVRRSLPAFKYRQQFLDAMAATQVLVVVGETGSGKTTQLPQYLYEAGYRKDPAKPMKIGCTQPRRVAATSVATRVAQEVGCKLGSEVGYNIRFEDVTSPATAIKYLTDGMLLREFLTDPLLSSYSALMIDEAHERTVSTEILLSLLKDVLKERKDLKVIVASATINASKFANYFDGAPIFTIPGRRFPVDICYTKNPEANYVQAAITTVFQIHMKQELSGDILVFLTGQEEIEAMEEALNDACAKLGDLIRRLIVAPIYANLPPKQQARIFEPTPPDARKVVLATNIAETSITIDGIKYVVDTGYVKENVYNAATGMESLVVVPCSRASADQRAGRAGRVGPGKCYRLFTKWSFNNELQANPTPEILRVNLCSVVLLLLSMGVTDLVHFDFMDPPNSQTLIRSLELLYALGAINGKGQITLTGQKMAEFPMDPMFCKALIASSDLHVMDEVLSIIAMLSENSGLFYRPKDKRELADKRRQAFAHELGDHFTLLNIWTQWAESGYLSLWCEDNFLQYRSLKRARDIRAQLERLCKRIGLVVEDQGETRKELVDSGAMNAAIQRAIFSGFFLNLARLSKTGANYVLVKRKQPVHIHPSSLLFKKRPPPKLVLYHELVLTSREYMRNCVQMDESLINELAAHYYSDKDLKKS